MMKPFFIGMLVASNSLIAVADDPGNSPIPDQEVRFRQEHSGETERYRFLAPTSVEYIRFVHDEHRAMLKGILGGIRARIDDPEELRSFVDQIEAISERSDEELKEFLDDLQSRLKRTDRIYYFSYARDEYRDYGLAVLREGMMVYRERWGYSKLPGTTIPDEEEVTFDRL